VATVIDTVQGDDGVFRAANDAERIAEGLRRGVGAVEEFVEGGRNVRNALDMLRRHIRSIGKPQRNPRPRKNPAAVLDAEEV
jgi:hypothetical protein